MGRFHEFIRLFERAFRRPAKTLTPLVNAFVDSRFGYTEEEVAIWFEHFRDPATHADARDEFLLESDVRPIIARMEQAATDVLFNKKDWRDPGTSRREVWTPKTGTTDDAGGILLTRGASATLNARLLDEYAAFPLDLSGIIAQPPESWWPPRLPASSQTPEFAVRVDPEDEFGAGRSPAK